MMSSTQQNRPRKCNIDIEKAAFWTTVSAFSWCLARRGLECRAALASNFDTNAHAIAL